MDMNSGDKRTTFLHNKTRDKTDSSLPASSKMIQEAQPSERPTGAGRGQHLLNEDHHPSALDTRLRDAKPKSKFIKKMFDTVRFDIIVKS